MSDLISRQAVLKLLSTMPPEEAMTKAMLIQSVKQMDAAQPEKRTDKRTETHACDSISRQEAIDVVSDCGICIQRIVDLPSVQLWQWVSCADRLPEYGKAVLTVNDDGDCEVNHIIDEDTGEWFYEGAIAWMPLPKPPKEG